ALEKQVLQREQELIESKRQLAGITQDRNTSLQQIQQLSAELDEQRKKWLDLAEERTAAVEADSQSAGALAQARQQVASISQERDAARVRAQEQAQEVDELQRQLDAARAQQSFARAISIELEEARRQIASWTTEREQQLLLGRQSGEERAAQEERTNLLDAQISEAERAREETLSLLTAAHAQVEEISRERDALRDQRATSALEAETQMTALRARLAELEQTAEVSREHAHDLTSKSEDARVLAQRFERQRLDSIDLSARFDAAQRDILELTANLAEARLHAKFAISRAEKLAGEGKRRQVGAAGAGPEALLVPADTLGLPPGLLLEADLSVSHDAGDWQASQEANSALASMRQCFRTVSKNPRDLRALNELHAHANGFAEHARVGGLVALHRLSIALAAFTHGLHEMPEEVNQSTLRTLNQTIEFLAALLRERNVGQLQDPTKSFAYAVDDDLGNCKAIAAALDKVSIRTTYSQESAVALTELASGRFDLVFLDVGLPKMDGFQLCSQIRQLPTHANTPVVFLTGLSTLENRVQSGLSGGSDFVAKPFNVQELGVKALTHILKAQLEVQ
ncbi:MAG: response regulator, partial [Verrucomicrobiota bacterium]|nr:response regulator [Verrucomicrobiota bacterium]